MIDLHMHTKYSDGQYTPEEVMQICHAASVDTVAITDHDKVGGIKEAQASATMYGMRFFRGIELSLSGDISIHMLGYGIDPENMALKKYCDSLEEKRMARRERIIPYLAEKGVTITLEQVAACNEGKTTGLPHYARTLVAIGAVSSIAEAFERYFRGEEFRQKVDFKKPTIEEGVAVIRGAGGVPVLAHPHRYKLEDERLDRLVGDLSKMGVRGIEAYYSRHTPEQVAFYRALAEKWGLIVTCGSDFHGEQVKPNIKAGTGIEGSLCVTDETIVQNLEREIALANKRSA